MGNSETKLVVAFDFGTTYSGYAYSEKDEFEKDPAKVFVNRTWHAQGPGLLSQKTPTCLLLKPNKEFSEFGYRAEEDYSRLTEDNSHKNWYYFRRFKMALHGEEDFDEDLMIEDETGKPLPALTVFSESIAYLVRTVEKELTIKGIDVKDHRITWVLTVPAIWNDSAKRFMRKAAVRAGIKPKQLKIALEPEAASLFCQYEMAERGRKTSLRSAGRGTKYMVVDLGGGTVDVTVHEKLAKGMVKEIYKASGGPWGGTMVDQGYTQLLIRIVGGPTMHKFREDAMFDYLDMLREFEVTKRSIQSYERPTNNFRIPKKLDDICQELNGENIDSITKSQNFPYRGKIKVINDKLIVDHEIVKQIFTFVTDKIIDHLDDVIMTENLTGLPFLLLVGGFAESSLVYDLIKSKYETNDRRVIVQQEPGLSVVKGAVIFGHTSGTIQYRILRYTYGTSPNTEFDPHKHPESRKFIQDGRERVVVFEPIIYNGSIVANGYTVTRELHYEDWSFNQNSVYMIYVTSNPETKYPDDPCCKLLRTIPVGRLLPTLPKQKRKCTANFIFGDTEVEIVIKEPKTGYRYSDKLDFKD